MKIKSTIHAALAAILFFLAGPAFAEPAGKSVPVNFRTFAIGGVANDLVYLDGSDPRPVTLDDERRSVFYAYHGSPAPLVFARMVSGPDGKEIPREVSRVTLPAAPDRLLLIFQKGTDGKEWSIRALPDTVETIPPGGYRFLNFLDTKAGIILGETKHLIEPGGEWTSVGRPSEGNLVFKVQVYKVPGETAVNVYSNIWSVDPSKRHLILIVPSSESHSGVEVRRLSEDMDTIPSQPLQKSSNSTSQ